MFLPQKIKLIVFLIFLFNPTFLDAQILCGKLSLNAGTIIKLESFNGLKTYTVSSGTTDGTGKFSLSYSTNDIGVGFLSVSNQKPFIVILSGEDIELEGESLSQLATLKIKKSQENQWFEQYANEHPRREQALSAWAYLEKMYGTDALFSTQKTPAQAIQQEKKRIQQEDAQFINALPQSAYVRWFLPVRQLVSSVSLIAQYRPEEITSTIAAFRALDYTDKRLYKSGLLKEAVENHFWLLENSGKPLDSVFNEMKLSIDAMLVHLRKDEKKLNEITDFLFDLLERHSLFQASEYLALKVLNESSCTIDQNLAKQLETYRAMKKGNIAPDLMFQGDIKLPNANSPVKKLSDVKSPYTVVVYGASWCPKCKEELPQIAQHYSRWKAQGVEVVFISLDEEKKAFDEFAQSFPFTSVCDFKKWESEMAKQFYVFATPTMFLLDQKREIVLRPNSVKQMDAWVDWFLEKGNKK
jgi:peroxiredoxin